MGARGLGRKLNILFVLVLVKVAVQVPCVGGSARACVGVNECVSVREHSAKHPSPDTAHSDTFANSHVFHNKKRLTGETSASQIHTPPSLLNSHASLPRYAHQARRSMIHRLSPCIPCCDAATSGTHPFHSPRHVLAATFYRIRATSVTVWEDSSSDWSPDVVTMPAECR